MRIYRRELLDQIQAENRTAVASPQAAALLARLLPPA
jgi:sRNA-binding carbon storage regulator CsrA